MMNKSLLINVPTIIPSQRAKRMCMAVFAVVVSGCSSVDVLTKTENTELTNRYSDVWYTYI
ncbi:hypothetical protein [Moritella yayanosii]|uniref:hypothetical protein n=1 Tax=Moritella yayanosii TaxID=69539 RepID=UPI0013A6BCAC|nr:hypothetical protein [Moritella yayanosii]